MIPKNMLDLGNDPLLEILARFSPLELTVFRQTCRRAYRLTKERCVWTRAALTYSPFLPDGPLESHDDRDLERYLLLDENWKRPSPLVRSSRHITKLASDIQFMELFHGRYMFIAGRSSLTLFDLETSGNDWDQPIFHQSEPRYKYFFASHRGPTGRSKKYGEIHISMIKRKYPTHDSVVILRLQPTEKIPLIQIAELRAPPLDDIPSVCNSNGLVFSDQGKNATDPGILPTIYDIASERTYRFPASAADTWQAHNRQYIEYIPSANLILVIHTSERGSFIPASMLQQDPSFETYAFPPPNNVGVLTQTHFNHGIFPGTFSEPVVISDETIALPSGASLGTKFTLVAAFNASDVPRPVEVRTFTVFLPVHSTDILFDTPDDPLFLVDVDAQSPLFMVHNLFVTSNNSGRARITARTHRLGRGSSDKIVLCEVNEGKISNPTRLSYGGSMNTPGYLFDGFRGRLVIPYPSLLSVVDFV
ncbi:hypothetical protein E1B28_002491 [Marasmius oreades]|uniref:F-box domain-containing protein n=1 Tax=Marasmius oreades TaxID=181124 RepID=A0A9P7ULT3_9AGAR|nr:uncharacterized protein E1B28_002491 [Marasmius oreades]KAG7086540.1 hypothetical protein E1B28_002491 [Marasmius oreades]